MRALSREQIVLLRIAFENQERFKSAAKLNSRLVRSRRRTLSFRRRRAGASRVGIVERRSATMTATEQCNELLTKDAAADRVEQKVDGETGDMQCLGVVAEHVEERKADVDDAGQHHLEEDEVDEDWEVEENVRRGDEDQYDG